MTRGGWRFTIPALVVGGWLALVAGWTHRFQAFSSFSAARLAAGPLPRAAPPLIAVDQDGATWDVGAPGGGYRLVQAMYLRCPDVCHIAMGRLAQLTRALADVERSRLRIVSLSIDHDSPAALQQMWRAHGSRSGWTMAALTADPVEPILERLGVYVFRRSDGLINHGVDILLIDPEGRVVRIFSADEGVQAVAEAVRSEVR